MRIKKLHTDSVIGLNVDFVRWIRNYFYIIPLSEIPPHNAITFKIIW